MRLKLKKLLAVTMAVATLSAFAINSSAYSGHINTNVGSACEADSQYMGSGTYNGRIGVRNMSVHPTGYTPQLHEVLYCDGYIILSKTFTANGSITKRYTIAGVTRVKFAYENYTNSHATLTADVYCDYNY